MLRTGKTQQCRQRFRSEASWREAQDIEVTVSNTSNGGTVWNLLYQIQVISRLAVSNTSDFLSCCCIKYKQLWAWWSWCRWVIKRVLRNLKKGWRWVRLHDINKKSNKTTHRENDNGGRRQAKSWLFVCLSVCLFLFTSSSFLSHNQAHLYLIRWVWYPPLSVHLSYPHLYLIRWDYPVSSSKLPVESSCLCGFSARLLLVCSWYNGLHLVQLFSLFSHKSLDIFLPTSGKYIIDWR